MPKDKESANLDQELEAMEVEMKRLQLIHLRHTVEKETQQRADIARIHRSQQLTLEQAREAEQYRQSLCPHKKGGKNSDGINHGTAMEYSVFTHTYATGEVVPMCTRCMKEWRKPEDSLKRSDPRAYKAQMKEYIEALKFPTDNEPSGTQLFMVEPYNPNDAVAAAERELANA